MPKSKWNGSADKIGLAILNGFDEVITKRDKKTHEGIDTLLEWLAELEGQHKDIVKNMATKKDIKDMPTKAQMANVLDRLKNISKAVNKR